jgi:hypothetical protein
MTVILNLILVSAVVILGYYASKLFFYMKLGRLEKGWRLVAQGAFILCGGFLFGTLQDLSKYGSGYYFNFDYVGTSLSIFGIVLMSFGLRSQYRVWSLRDVNSKSKLKLKEFENSEEHATKINP